MKQPIPEPGTRAEVAREPEPGARGRVRPGWNGRFLVKPVPRTGGHRPRGEG
ncbi:hypothetical protein OG589_16410 [Sphaerisporangium sp. NBC_01403]|uniref:hypothetical protein n=1 Tax=Sphaerisporangium sp. NBC_01403 TaxID=2903599 RepID=UPI0032493D5F